MADVAVADIRSSAFLREKPEKQVDAAGRRKALRKRLFIAFGALLAIVGVAYGGWWYWTGLRYISTDDAYVGADSAQITPQINGTVGDVTVSNTAHVKRNQVLIRIDPADAALAAAQAEATYAQTVRQVEQNFANSGQAAAQVEARKSDVNRALQEYNHRIALQQADAIAAEQVTEFRNAYETAQANLVAAQQSLAAQQALIRGVDVAHNPEVLAAKAALDIARLNLSRTTIRAPFDGVVAQKNVQIGQRVQVGQTLMSVVPVNSVYVDANFKEGQLTKVNAGQPVDLTSDLYGSKVVFHGHVQGLSGGTGSAFAVIPAQNATGNWIKVVQRLPVRVALDPRELEQHPLRVGLSMIATIDTAQP
ncbi:MAG TPA: HlyD family efflux transporter periplasmic adaptor subunit [Rhizomicrobium sp.]|jgi:membrane fusion protein (multidrug efflux system)